MNESYTGLSLITVEAPVAGPHTRWQTETIAPLYRCTCARDVRQQWMPSNYHRRISFDAVSIIGGV